MRSRSTGIATLVVFALALAFSPVTGVSQLQLADASDGPVAGIAIQRLGSSYSFAGGYDRYSYVIVGRRDAAAAVAQPGKTLVYHSGTDVNSEWDVGIPITVAQTNGWLLRDNAGALLTNVVFPSNYIGDVGDPRYQAKWARRVGDYLASIQADGVYIDDVVANVTMMTGGVAPAKYPTEASWEDATVSFIASVGAALKNRGFYVLVNANKWIANNPGSDDGTLTAGWWTRLAPHVSGLLTEHFVTNATNPSQLRSTGREWYQQWDAWQGLISVAQRNGRDFFGLAYATATSTAALRYLKGSFLLDWNGAGGALIVNPSPDANTPGDADPWSPEWTIDIGEPSGSKFQVGDGWRRNYTLGTVVVNPSANTSQTFALDVPYLTPDGTRVTSVTLGPTSALILRSVPDLPVATALPSISGTPQQGAVLTSSTGTWSGGPSSYAYQWNSCDSGGFSCIQVSGATTAQLTRRQRTLAGRFASM